MNYLNLCNRVLHALNEVELTSSNFANSKGIQTAVKEFINRSVNDIYTSELEWPFLHTDGTITTVAGTAEYSLVSGYKSVDVDTVYLIEASTDVKILSYIPYNQFTNQFRERDLDPTTTDNRAKPEYFYLTQDDKLGLTPIPDKEYTVYYEYWATHTDLDASTDEPAVPARYQDTIVTRAEYYVHQLRSNIDAASMKHKEYEKKIERMRVDLINKPDYMKSTAITSGIRSNTRHPKYF
jgi:hypothetical protein|tara:strand:- start:735 stop:1448 length:714 start_codon:yes stop_codon:yes gene_type:complete